MTAKLTSRFLDTVAPDPAKRLELPDGLTPGLYFIVQPSGAKSWAVRYRHRGRPAKMTLGKYPLLSLADAREAAREALRDAALGGDPAEAKRRQAAALATLPESLGDLCDRYRDEHLKKRVRNWRNNQAEIETHIRPALGRYHLDELTRAHVREMLKGIVAKGYPVAANRVLTRLRAMLNWALAEDLVEVNIAAGIKKPTKERPRDRTLTDGELVAIWRGTEDLSYPAREFMRLLLLTGQRRDDVRKMHWDEVDLKAATWTIPAGRYKTGRAHLVP
ncbi:MAG: integrase arm-type DNA-binding domain-containing protein, partial [Alphaproteobacteria bacterium]|nr:integrase arm-type DNA-binding domain-containing protein [Alphaproteobacteria bacterium]